MKQFLLRHKCLCIFMSIVFWIWALSGIWKMKFVCLICYFFAQFFGKMRICGFFPSFSPYNVQIKYFNIIVMNIRFKHWTAIKRKSKLFSLFLLVAVVMFPRKKNGKVLLISLSLTQKQCIDLEFEIQSTASPSNLFLIDRVCYDIAFATLNIHLIYSCKWNFSIFEAVCTSQKCYLELKWETFLFSTKEKKVSIDEV